MSRRAALYTIAAATPAGLYGNAATSRGDGGRASRTGRLQSGRTSPPHRRGTNVPMCRLPRARNIEAELLDMKDRVVRTRVQQRSSADWSDLPWPAPLASPAPELEGVADELRQLYEMYSDHDEVPERLAALARSAADAYEQLAGDPPTPTCAEDTPAPAEGASRKRH